MKTYTNLLEIEKDLQMIQLERDIAVEELKAIKNGYEEKLKPINIALSVLKITSKYGLLLYLKDIFTGNKKKKN
jgi:hypothetical protein